VEEATISSDLLNTESGPNPNAGEEAPSIAGRETPRPGLIQNLSRAFSCRRLRSEGDDNLSHSSWATDTRSILSAAWYLALPTQ
jgi:hypothetical protein